MSGVPFTPDEMDGIKQSIVKAMSEGANVTFHTACSQTAVSISQAYAWRKTDLEWDEEVKVARKTSVENGLDFAESKLMQNINEAKEASVFFYLKTQGKSRGYVERVEQTGADGAPLAPPTVNVAFPHAHYHQPEAVPEEPIFDAGDTG